MPDGDGFFYPPVQYQPWWMIIGFAILLLVAGWYIWLFWSTRSRAARPEPMQNYATGPPLRDRYFSLIDETQRQFSGGELTPREAHHQLSLLLRSYVTEREGIRTMHMTLADLRETDLEPLTDAVAKLYPGAFSADYPGTVEQAAEEARRLVSAWR